MMARAYPRESDWQSEALSLWMCGKIVREIAETVGQPIEEVSAFLGRETYKAVDLALRGGGWK